VHASVCCINNLKFDDTSISCCDFLYR